MNSITFLTLNRRRMKRRNDSDKLITLLKQCRYTVRPDFTQTVMDEILSTEDKRESNPLVQSLLQRHGRKKAPSNFTYVLMERVQTLPVIPTKRILPRLFWYFGTAIIILTIIAAFYFDHTTKSPDQPVGSLIVIGNYISAYVGSINGMYGIVAAAGLVLMTVDYFFKNISKRTSS